MEKETLQEVAQRIRDLIKEFDLSPANLFQAIAKAYSKEKGENDV